MFSSAVDACEGCTSATRVQRRWAHRSCPAPLAMSAARSNHSPASAWVGWFLAATSSKRAACTGCSNWPATREANSTREAALLYLQILSQTYDDAALAEAPNNDALAANGTSAFGSSELDFGIHYIRHINDGFYGNSKSWIAKFTAPADMEPFVGLNFGGVVEVGSIAWGRDNGNTETDGCGGTCRDRSIDVYQLDYTTVQEPDADTPEADDPAEGWVAIGSVEFKTPSDTFSPWLRHRFDVSLNGQPIPATGIRIRVNSNQTAIDEVEINTGAEQDAKSQLSITLENGGLVVSWTGDAILESSGSLGSEAKWSEVTDQSNPYSVPSELTGTGTRFYRSRSK